MSAADPVAAFGQQVTKKLALPGGEPEDQLRGPFETLVGALADQLGIHGVALSGEHRLAEERVRPDYAVYVQGALVGFIEMKAPGLGADPRRFKGTNRQQWERLSCLPNVLYTDGQSFGLFRDGELDGRIIQFEGEITQNDDPLRDPSGAVAALIDNFLRWIPVPPRRPRELARTAARLCHVLRAEVAESLQSESSGLHDLAADWRRYLYPDATDAEFADGYAQTVTFALLLARVEGIELAGTDLRSVADQLGQHHTLMARALSLLTDQQVLPKLAGSVLTLQRVLGVVDWPTLSKNDPAAWLFFYEEFLQHYDPKLRKQTGSYYTPVEAVRPIVRMIDEILRTRLGQASGFASDAVTVVDPAVGTGSFLFGVLDRLSETITDDLGPGAVGPALNHASQRLIGFELQAGPYAVAELRLATEYFRRGASPHSDQLRVFLADTLSDPYVEETELPAVYRQIGVSRQRANTVKRDTAVMVVLGNPPYKERSKGRGGWIEKGGHGHHAPLDEWFPDKASGLGAHAKHLYNLYTYFWRWASWKVFENHPTDRGVIAFVTVAGFVNGPGFSAMRADLRRKADAIWIIDCTPEGHQPDVSTRFFAGVQQPICITIMVRDGSTGPDQPAAVHYTALTGNRQEKFASLDTLDLDGDAWQPCPTDWAAPFLPASQGVWSTMPALDDLLAWSGSGTMPGRTWVVGPSKEILQQRWQRFVSAPLDDKSKLLKQHPRDRTIHTKLSDALAGYPARGTLAHDAGDGEAPIRYGVRTLDRAWIIPDKRLINQPNPGLWQVRDAPEQLFLTCLDRHAPRSGSATSATALIPDLHHYRGSFGGRAYPLWLDRAGTMPNVVPGVLEELGRRLGIEAPLRSWRVLVNRSGCDQGPVSLVALMAPCLRDLGGVAASDTGHPLDR